MPHARTSIVSLLVFFVLAAPAALAEESAPPAAKPWYEELAVNGFLSATYSYNLNRPDSGKNQLRVFDFDDNSFKVDVVTLTLQKAAGKPGDTGFRVDADAGASIPRVTAAYGLFQGQDFDLKQAFVTYIAPLGTGLRLDAGKLLTHFSYEYIESWDTPNDNVTRSFAFGYAFPATHTGLRATYSLATVSAMLMVTNGWDDVKDNNSAKSLCAQAVWSPSKAVTVTGNFMTGPERANVDTDPRTVYEVVVQWKPRDTLVLGLDVLYGDERGAVTPGRVASWSGVTGYARLGLTDRFALCFRAEYFDDGAGARTAVAQTLRELTATPEYRVSPHMIVRGDLRLDWSNRPVFEKHGSQTSRTQPTGILNVAYLF